jgi:glycosyltransferase involved in cell wall biosynthesis
MPATNKKKGRVLIIVENLPLPFDRRVWQEATTLREAGYTVSIVCPTGKGYEKRYEQIDGIHIYRHNLLLEAEGAIGYALEYASALLWEFALAWKVMFRHGFDVIHACNPPDLIFLVGGFFKFFARKKFIFDHHDINPELYEAKFGRRDRFYKLMVLCERLTFRTADVSIATNESYKRIAIERGGMDPQKVFVVRSGPKLDRLKIVPPVPALKQGRKYLVGYVGVMGKQEGVDHLLRAASHLVHDLGRTDVHFGLVGGGTSLEDMKAYAQELRIADHVTFTGRVPDNDLLNMLNTADICVNPDVANAMNDKSTMNKIMEYMALGKPIVQFDLTEGRFSAGEASLYAARNDELDMAHKIVELLDDPERRARMGEFGRNRVVNELEWCYEAPKLLAAYKAALA